MRLFSDDLGQHNLAIFVMYCIIALVVVGFFISLVHATEVNPGAMTNSMEKTGFAITNTCSLCCGYIPDKATCEALWADYEALCADYTALIGAPLGGVALLNEDIIIAESQRIFKAAIKAYEFRKEEIRRGKI